jgi:hypothetical protein
VIEKLGRCDRVATTVSDRFGKLMNYREPHRSVLRMHWPLDEQHSIKRWTEARSCIRSGLKAGGACITDEDMVANAAECVVRHLESAGFVVRNKPQQIGGALPRPSKARLHVRLR